MKILYRWAYLLCGLSITGNALANTIESYQCAGNQAPLTPKGKLELISKDFAFLEGPTWSSQNQVFYFSEMHFERDEGKGPYSNIYQITLPDNISLFKENSGSNGLLATKNKLIAMNHGIRGVSILFSQAKEQPLAEFYQGLKFNSPNDAAISKNETIYFSDPDWQLNGRTPQLEYTGLFAIKKNGNVKLLDKTLIKPNGVAISPNEKWLYVGDYSHQVYRYEIDENGDIGRREPFIKIDTPDGITIDCAGNIYVAAHVQGKINIYSEAGQFINSINIGHKVTNMAFGGKDLKTLLITTTQGLYKLKTNIPGKALF